MSDLIVIGFDDPHEADRVLNELQHLQKEYLVDLEDAVVVVRDANGKVHMKQSVSLVGPAAASGALWGGLWGSLVGLLFLNPLIGFAAGAAAGAGSAALAASLADYGINDDFMREVGETLKPNTSALFILVRKMQPEKVLAELSRFKGHIIRSSLSPEQEARLQAALSGQAARSGASTANPSPAQASA